MGNNSWSYDRIPPEVVALIEAMARELPPPVSTIQELIEGADKPHPLVAQARALLARIRNGGSTHEN